WGHRPERALACVCNISHNRRQSLDTQMRRASAHVVLALLVLSGLVVTATAAGGPTAPTSRAVVKTAYNKILKKTILVDGKGRTLYLRTYDAAACRPVRTKRAAPLPGRRLRAPGSRSRAKGSTLD